MRKRLRVAVLAGGKSPEHEISLISGREVIRNLDPKKYDVLAVIIARDGLSWRIGESEKLKFQLDSSIIKVKSSAKGPRRREASEARRRRQKLKIKSLQARSLGNFSIIKNHQVDVAFVAMHGPYGEDGTVQGFLELVGVPYTGSGVLASALGMDKISSRKLFIQAGLNVPGYMIMAKGNKPSTVWKYFKTPVFVKPSNQGSSVGASKVAKKEDLPKALELAWSFSDWVLVEEYLEGREVTGAVLGNGKPVCLPLVEIVTKHDFFDYEAKYDEKLTEEIVPARIGKELTKKAQKAAITAYQVLGCRGFGRVDMIIKNNQTYVLEVNTIPGLTPVSLFPKAAKAVGIAYPQLLDKIINLALEKS